MKVKQAYRRTNTEPFGKSKPSQYANRRFLRKLEGIRRNGRGNAGNSYSKELGLFTSIYEAERALVQWKWEIPTVGRRERKKEVVFNKGAAKKTPPGLSQAALEMSLAPPLIITIVIWLIST